MHKVVVERSHGVVSLIAEGYFDETGLTAAAADLHRAIRSLGARAGRHVTMYDLTALNVVTPAVLDAFARYFSDPRIAPLWARRVALVTRSLLVTQQMERVRQVKDTLRIFNDRRAAMAWLLADQERLRTTSQPTAASG